MAHLLITGGSSFLGGHLIAAAAGRGRVTATYLTHRPHHDQTDWLQVDLADPEALRHKLGGLDPAPDCIIHNAAQTNVDWCENNRSQAEDINVGGSAAMAGIAASLNARLVYISTDLVFDGQHPPYAESAAPNPVSHYGWTKWQGELAVAETQQDHLIIRPAIMYGPAALLGTSFSEWMRQTWLRGEKTALFADQYRTPIYAGNLAQAVLALAGKGEVRGLVHIGGSERISRWEFGLKLAGHLGMGTEGIEKSTMAAADLVGRRPADVSLNAGLAQRLLTLRLLDCDGGIAAAYP